MNVKRGFFAIAALGTFAVGVGFALGISGSASQAPAPAVPKTVAAPEIVAAPVGIVRTNAAFSADETARAALRRNYPGLDLTDEQADLLLAADRRRDLRQADLDRDLDARLLSPKEHGEQARAGETERRREYERVLGPDVYAEYLKKQDGNYQALERLAAGWQLDRDGLESLYTVTSTYEKSVLNYRRRAQLLEEQGESVDWEGVQENLREYTAETEQALREKIGEARLAELQEHHLFNSEN